MQYIDGTLKLEFELDTTSKPKPVAGPDDLLLMLVQHWARDESVYPTEDDRHDVATMMLFQAYTGGRPAEFVHASKGKASEDPLGEKEASNKDEDFEKVAHSDYNDSDVDNDSDSDTSDGPGSDGDVLFDSEDDGGDDVFFDSEDDGGDEDNEDMGEHRGSDSGYASDRTDVTMTEDTDKCYTTKLDESGKPLRHSNATERGDFEEAKRKYKALCYEDICIWIVQNPTAGERDVLAMEVNLQNHKGVDNKPKP